MNDATVSRQWASRPDDNRFMSLDELFNSVNARAECTETFAHNMVDCKVYGSDGVDANDLGELIVNTNHGPKTFSNWSFGQVSTIAGAPSSYLKKLTSPLTAANLNEGLARAKKEDFLLQAYDDELRCATSISYGRIWDRDVVAGVQDVTAGGSWKIPAASYSAKNPKKATTLYASDRDVFMFLVDEDHPIEWNGRNMNRGFYVWNSEVGAQTFGLAAFLYDYVCDNRTIWGVENRQEIKFRHTAGAPERFRLEGKHILKEYTDSSVKPLIEQLERAKNMKIGKDEDEVKEFLRKRGLQLRTADLVVKRAIEEENEYNTAWSVAQGITAFSRSIQHQDERIKMEKLAGKIISNA